MKPMTYKGYSARIEYSDEDDCFIGRLAGIRDIITFHGNFVEEVRHAFQEAVDFYLETCRQRNEAPQKPYSGKISLRISPNIHARMAMQAAWATQFGLGNLFAAADRGVAGDRLPIACGFALAHPLTASSRSRSIWPAVLL